MRAADSPENTGEFGTSSGGFVRRADTLEEVDGILEALSGSLVITVGGSDDALGEVDRRAQRVRRNCGRDLLQIVQRSRRSCAFAERTLNSYEQFQNRRPLGLVLRWHVPQELLQKVFGAPGVAPIQGYFGVTQER